MTGVTSYMHNIAKRLRLGLSIAFRAAAARPPVLCDALDLKPCVRAALDHLSCDRSGGG
jgi:hypothetical protein